MSNFYQNLDGQFALELGGQFAPKLMVNLDWKVVVNLTVFSNKSMFSAFCMGNVGNIY